MTASLFDMPGDGDACRHGRLADCPWCDDVRGAVGRDHPTTSVDAAKRLRSGSQHAQIIIALTAATSGLTADEMSGRIMNKAGHPIAVNQIATRLGELRARGFVDYEDNLDGGRAKRATSSGNSALVQIATAAGRRVAASLEDSPA